ncbi:MAG: hypothetical protein LBS14_01375 [Holosporaceae bacterium]|jgi:hypothetical protein|nr:hypothetical protein [Holosporaceae bacterium]
MRRDLIITLPFVALLVFSCYCKTENIIQQQGRIGKKNVSESIWDEVYSNPENVRRILAADKSDVGRLDYALFIYAFSRPSSKRNKRIKEITDALVCKALAAASNYDKRLFSGKISFDGSYKSLVNILRILSCCGITNTHLMCYVIPSPVLQSKPELLEATKKYLGINELDNSLPSWGLMYGRGAVMDFPKEEVDNYIKTIKKYLKGKDKFHIISDNLHYIYGKIVFDYGCFMFLKGEYFDDFERHFLNISECKAAFENAKVALLKYGRRYKFACGKDRRGAVMDACATNALVCLWSDLRAEKNARIN